MKSLKNERAFDRLLAGYCSSSAYSYRETIGVCFGSLPPFEVGCMKSLKNDRGFDRRLAWHVIGNACDCRKTIRGLRWELAL